MIERSIPRVIARRTAPKQPRRTSPLCSVSPLGCFARLVMTRGDAEEGYTPYIERRIGARSSNWASRFSALALKASAISRPENMPVCQVAI